jgi:YD repeat-containing protein
MFLGILCLIFPSTSTCEGIQYLYDSAGRLSKVITSDGQVAIYIYDSAGNLLSIVTQTINEQPPLLDSITPDILFTGTDVEITINGQNLMTLEDFSSDNSSIIINFFESTDNTITAQISLPSETPTGLYNFHVKTFYGEAEIGFYVTSVKVTPENTTLSINASKDVEVTIEPTVSRTYTFNVENKAPEVVSTASSVTIPSGGSAYITVNALSEGSAVIKINGAGLNVFVTQPFAGDASISSNPINVQMLIDSNIAPDVVSVQMPIEGYIITDSVSVKIEN